MPDTPKRTDITLHFISVRLDLYSEDLDGHRKEGTTVRISKRIQRCGALLLTTLVLSAACLADAADQTSRKLVYLVSDQEIPFWDIMSRGMGDEAARLGYQFQIRSAGNDPKQELVHAAAAIREKVAGIIVSPTTSSACATLLKLANKAGVPVVIADIGTDSGSYVSYISSDNREGAYQLGRVLSERMTDLNWLDGKVGIVAIPQKRQNGRDRTSGFMQALQESGIRSAGIRQQVDFSDEETYRHSRELIDSHPDLRALWLQGSNRYQAALRAIEDSGRSGEILLITFDAEPEFLQLIPQGVLVGSAMQQPYLMGKEAAKAMDRHLNGQTTPKNLQLPILAISAKNIDNRLPSIRENVLGLKQ